jgi:hypothetical protein
MEYEPICLPLTAPDREKVESETTTTNDASPDQDQSKQQAADDSPLAKERTTWVNTLVHVFINRTVRIAFVAFAFKA